MAITARQQASGVDTTTSGDGQVSLGLPSAPVAGNLLLFSCANRDYLGGTQTVTWPAGVTEIIQHPDAPLMDVRVAYRVAEAGDPSSWQVNYTPFGTTNDYGFAQLVEFQGWVGTPTLNGSAAAGSIDDQQASFDTPALAIPDCVVFSFTHHRNATHTCAPEVGYTEVFDLAHSANTRVALAFAEKDANGAEVVSWTYLNTSRNSASIISFTDVVATGISDYLVEYRTNTGPGPWQAFADGVDPTTGATITGLTPSGFYDIRVSAVNGEGAGPWSNVITVQAGAEGTVTIYLGDLPVTSMKLGDLPVTAAYLGDTQIL